MRGGVRGGSGVPTSRVFWHHPSSGAIATPSVSEGTSTSRSWSEHTTREHKWFLASRAHRYIPNLAATVTRAFMPGRLYSDHKEGAMEEKWTYGLWGAAIGAAALAVGGFSWGGWMTGGSAEALTTKRSQAALVAVLTPICIERFKASTNAARKSRGAEEDRLFVDAQGLRREAAGGDLRPRSAVLSWRTPAPKPSTSLPEVGWPRMQASRSPLSCSAANATCRRVACAR